MLQGHQQIGGSWCERSRAKFHLHQNQRCYQLPLNKLDLTLEHSIRDSSLMLMLLQGYALIRRQIIRQLLNDLKIWMRFWWFQVSKKYFWWRKLRCFERNGSGMFGKVFEKGTLSTPIQSPGLKNSVNRIKCFGGIKRPLHQRTKNNIKIFAHPSINAPQSVIRTLKSKIITKDFSTLKIKEAIWIPKEIFRIVTVMNFCILSFNFNTFCLCFSFVFFDSGPYLNIWQLWIELFLSVLFSRLRLFLAVLFLATCSYFCFILFYSRMISIPNCFWLLSLCTPRFHLNEEDQVSTKNGHKRKIWYSLINIYDVLCRNLAEDTFSVKRYCTLNWNGDIDWGV